MLQEIIGAHIEEVKTRLRYRQDPKVVTEDLLKRGIIVPDQYESSLEEMESLYQQYEEERMTKTNRPIDI